MPVTLIYDPTYLGHDTGAGHFETPARLERILEAIAADAALTATLRRARPRPALEQDILRCHDGAMIEAIRAHIAAGGSHLDSDTPVSGESFEIALLAAGGAITAVDTVMTEEGGRAFALVRPPGHHATSGRPMGFCIFNNAAVAARYAEATYGVERTLIVDWDVHHGNGTQEIFWRDNRVFYFSTHQSRHYPGTGATDETGDGQGDGFTLNIPLRAGTSGREHREAFRLALEHIESRFHPDLVIISAGFDSRRGDPLGNLMLEDSDFAEMTKDVLRIAETHAKGRVVSLLEGGYNLEQLGATAREHLKALG